MLPPQRRTLVSHAQTAANQLSLLIEDLLEVAKIDENRLTLQSTAFNPAESVRRVVAMVKVLAARKQVKIVMRNHTNGALIKADQDKFERIITNLLDNAVKFTLCGGVVTVSSTAVADSVQITVSDTGIGIGTRNLSRIFDKFFREDPEMVTGAGGTGLGLYITKQLVERLGGAVKVVSQRGQGTTFTIVLPRVLDDAPATTTGRRQSSGAS